MKEKPKESRTSEKNKPARDKEERKAKKGSAKMKQFT